jgi:hypothetical protein
MCADIGVQTTLMLIFKFVEALTQSVLKVLFFNFNLKNPYMLLLAI